MGFFTTKQCQLEYVVIGFEYCINVIIKLAISIISSLNIKGIISKVNIIQQGYRRGVIRLIKSVVRQITKFIRMVRQVINSMVR